jgi:hypothetical protein
MPTMVSAFIELIHEIPQYVGNLARYIFTSLYRIVSGIFKVFTGAFGLWLANIATVIATLIAVAQYQFFEQIAEVTTEICGDDNSFSAWRDLLSHRDNVVFVNFIYNRTCALPDVNESSSVEIVKIKYDHLFTTFIFPGTPYVKGKPAMFFRPNTVVSTRSRVYQIRVAQGIGRNFTWTKDPLIITEQRPYMVKMDYTDANITLTLIPAAVDEKLARQLECRKKNWSAWTKSLVCPFLSVDLPPAGPTIRRNAPRQSEPTTPG